MRPIPNTRGVHKWKSSPINKESPAHCESSRDYPGRLLDSGSRYLSLGMAAPESGCGMKLRRTAVIIAARCETACVRLVMPDHAPPSQ